MYGQAPLRPLDTIQLRKLVRIREHSHGRRCGTFGSSETLESRSRYGPFALITNCLYRVRGQRRPYNYSYKCSVGVIGLCRRCRSQE